MSLPVYYTYYNADKKLVLFDEATDVRSRLEPKDDALKGEALRALFRLARDSEGLEGMQKKMREVSFIGVALAGHKPSVVSVEEVVAYAAKEGAKIGAFPPGKYDAQKRAVVESAFPAPKAS